ncbi:MAG: RNAse M5 [Gracilibacter sp. BRH_c7a]|nr:MAG: RNAse M5 [Gracilibacter sp. BRH_c7a]
MKNQPPTDNDRLTLEELIVVEGKNDAHAIRKALGDVDIIWTEGFGLTEDKLNLISEMAERRGVIVCTDPDFVGRQIRDRISTRVPKVKHVFISRQAAVNKKGNDIGVENVSSNDIRKAFKKVLEKSSEESTAQGDNYDSSGIIKMEDLVDNGLVGQEGSAAKRHVLGKILGVGDNNAKQFLYRVNRFKISKDDFIKALSLLEVDRSRRDG